MRIVLPVVLAGVVAWARHLEGGEPATPLASAALPPVAKVLDRYVEAMGGRSALEKIRSRHIKGEAEISVMPGSPAPWELITKSPNLPVEDSRFARPKE